MNELGILIDLSHVGDRTTLETIEHSRKPVAFTHANARSFMGHVRNKPDDALRLLAERGGVVGANAFPTFLPKLYESTLSDYADAIDDLVDRVGIDHVGIGTDFCQGPARLLLRLAVQPVRREAQGAAYHHTRPALPPPGLRDPGRDARAGSRAVVTGLLDGRR